MRDELRPPIFLLGNVRSGTTLVQDLFALHPDVTPWFEPRTVWMYADPSRAHDRFDERDATPRVRRYIARRFLKEQRIAGGKAVMEKTPSNLLRAPYMHAIFPESKYVYVVRHPFAYISSAEFRWRQAITYRRAISRLLESPTSQLHHYAGKLFADHFRKKILKRTHVSVWGVRYPGVLEDLRTLTTEQVISKQWSECSKQMETDMDAIGRDRFVKIRYEDLVQDPHMVFAQVLGHFGLTPTPEIDEALSTQIDTSRTEKWHRLDPKIVESCTPYLETEMARHGYETQPLDYEQRSEEQVHEQSVSTKGTLGSGGGVSPLS